jgi:hypothetical protein
MAGYITVPGTTRSQAGPPMIIKQGIYDISSTAYAPVGTRFEFGDGRVFHYALNGAVALAAGKMNEGVAPSADHLKCAVAAAVSVGAVSISLILNGSTVVTQNQYAGGFLNIGNGTGSGFTTYKIRDHLAGTAGATVVFNLFDPVQVALTATGPTMYGTLTQNPWNNVVIAPAGAAQAQMPVGVNLVAVTAAYYFWLQTWGPVGCLLGAGPPAISDYLMTSAATAGALITYAVTASRTPVGWLMRAEAAADYGLVFLTIAP